MSPESLRLYRRLGAREMIALVDRAEHATVDTIQMGNIPIVDQSEGYGALLQHCCTPASVSRKQRALEATLDGATTTACRTHAPLSSRASSDAGDSDVDEEPDLSPLVASSAVGRQVLVPAALWPTYACNELAGRGWVARVLRCNNLGVAKVRFLRATTARGLPYADADLQLTALEPI